MSATPTKVKAGELDHVFLALGHQTRRELLLRLAQGEATVGSLAEPFHTSLNAISRHLQVLERAGLIEREIVGREHYCRLNPAQLEAASDWLAYYRTFWSQRLDALERELLTRRLARRQRHN
jgi:DNA-binding transcriptional ArsR family regulator